MIPRGFNYKPDIKPFPELRNDADFAPWYEEVMATARAQGFEGIFLGEQPDPYNQAECLEFDRKLAFGYMLLKKKVLTPQGKRIIQNHRQTWDAQKVLEEIIHHNRHSTHAVLSGRNLLEKLTTIVFEASSGRSAVTFITTFERMLETYNDQQSDTGMMLPPPMMKAMLQRAVAGVSMLQDVANREQERIAQGGALFDFLEYLQVLKSTAAIYDQKRQKRSAHTHAIIGWDEDEPGGPSLEAANTMEEAIDYVINEMRRRSPGSSMNKETWKSISKEGQGTWDKMSDSDKAKILRYAAQRASQDKERVESNTHSIDHGTNATDEIADANQDEASHQDDEDTMAVNNAVSEARGQAHPGDPRRMLGNDRERPSLQVKNACWETDPFSAQLQAVDHYWDSDSDSSSDFQ